MQGFDRRLNNDKVSYWSVSFRHDIPETDWAYGLFADAYTDAPSYRLGSVNNEIANNPFGLIFVEHKDVFGLRVNSSVRNIFFQTDDFDRIAYSDRRDLGFIDLVESRSRDFDLFFRLEITGTF